MKFTPADRVTADHWQARKMARDIALMLAGLPLDDEQRKEMLARWVADQTPITARARPDISREQNKKLLCGIAARAILLLREMRINPSIN